MGQVRTRHIHGIPTLGTARALSEKIDLLTSQLASLEDLATARDTAAKSMRLALLEPSTIDPSRRWIEVLCEHMLLTAIGRAKANVAAFRAIMDLASGTGTSGSGIKLAQAITLVQQQGQSLIAPKRAEQAVGLVLDSSADSDSLSSSEDAQPGTHPHPTTDRPPGVNEPQFPATQENSKNFRDTL